MSGPPNFVLKQTERLFGSSSPFMWIALTPLVAAPITASLL